MNTETETQLEFDFMKPEQLNFEFDKNQTLYLSQSPLLLTLTPNYSVSFHREEKMIGKLDWNHGPMTFEGDAEESAQIFFDNIIKRYIQTQLPIDGWKS